jgi:hypothetical protein
MGILMGILMVCLWYSYGILMVMLCEAGCHVKAVGCDILIG